MNVDNQYMKINAVALIAGKKALVSNVEQITGQKIDHVAQIKFGGLQNVVTPWAVSNCAMTRMFRIPIPD